MGIDPGLDGAAAIVGPDLEVIVMDLPTRVAPGGGMVRRRLDGGRLLALLAEHVPRDRKTWRVKAVIEDVHTFPGERNAPQTQGSLMHSLGVIECALQVLGVEFAPLQVSTWKKFYGLGADKNAARRRAAQLMPDAAAWLERVMDHNRAEALLMAHYLQRHEG